VAGALATVCTLSANARAEEKLEALAGAGTSFRHTTAIDLAKIAGASGYGSANDAGPGALGFELRAGVWFPFQLELDATGSIAAGGLNLSRVEERYLGASPQPLGSTLTASADFGVRFAPLVTPGIRLLLGPSAGAERMSATSPAGAARLDMLHVGLDAGLRLHTNRISRVVDGNIEAVVGVRRELPFHLSVSKNGSDDVFSGTQSEQPQIYSFGIAVQYVFSFHAPADGNQT
jgi:hypothetical protein